MESPQLVLLFFKEFIVALMQLRTLRMGWVTFYDLATDDWRSNCLHSRLVGDWMTVCLRPFLAFAARAEWRKKRLFTKETMYVYVVVECSPASCSWHVQITWELRRKVEKRVKGDRVVPNTHTVIKPIYLDYLESTFLKWLSNMILYLNKKLWYQLIKFLTCL